MRRPSGLAVRVGCAARAASDVRRLRQERGTGTAPHGVGRDARGRCMEGIVVWVACALFAAGMVCDLRSRRIPNAIPLALLGRFAVCAAAGEAGRPANDVGEPGDRRGAACGGLRALPDRRFRGRRRQVDRSRRNLDWTRRSESLPARAGCGRWPTAPRPVPVPARWGSPHARSMQRETDPVPRLVVSSCAVETPANRGPAPTGKIGTPPRCNWAPRPNN